MSGVAFIFVGPSEMLNFSNSLLLMGIGQALVGIFTAFMMIPGLPEMVESTIPLYPGQERDVNDISSGLYNAFLGFGQVIAPAYGSFVTEAVGFRWTSDIVAIICFVFALVYVLIAGGIEAFGKTFCGDKAETKSPLNLSGLKGQDDGQYSTHSMNRSRSSSYMMVGPVSPGISKMRIQSAIEAAVEESPALNKSKIVSTINYEQGMEERNARPLRNNRLLSDIDGMVHNPNSNFSSIDQ